jgi:hypothetical protein
MRNIARVRRDRAIEVEMSTFHGIRPSIVRNDRAKLTIVPQLNRVSTSPILERIALVAPTRSVGSSEQALPQRSTRSPK